MKDKKFERILRTKSELKRAVNEGEMKVFLQPQICVSKHRIYGFEALVRREHPVFGILSPHEFLDDMNRMHMMEELDYFVYREVCLLLKKRMEEGRPLFRVSCNFCRKQFMDPGFAEQITAIAEEYRIPPKYLALEMIEGQAFQKPVNAIAQKNVKLLRARGFTVCLDDCGADVSSIGDLMIDSIGQIKLDKRLTDSIERENVQILVTGLCQIALQLQCCVVGEGIETEQQLNDMRKCGVDIVQGFYYYKPMEFRAATELYDLQNGMNG